MLLAKEQRIAALVLFSIALIAWFIVAVWPSRQTQIPEPQQVPPKRSWEERRDSMRRADSIRYAEWDAEREQKYAEYKATRQQIWDSMRIADSLWRDSVGWRYTAQHVKKDTILDLNLCDTTELQYIRGIGRYTAVQIVQYRERLGGFYSPAQLTDEALQKCHLDTLLAHFTADAKDIRCIDINRCNIEMLQRHPYLRYEQAKAIYNLRRKQLRLTSLDDLRALPELSDSDLQRIAPYLCFE